MEVHEKAFENIVEKGEHAGDPYSPFPTLFSTLSRTNFIILTTCNL